jgi:hypothetical protein
LTALVARALAAFDRKTSPAKVTSFDGARRKGLRRLRPENQPGKKSRLLTALVARALAACDRKTSPAKVTSFDGARRKGLRRLRPENQPGKSHVF